MKVLEQLKKLKEYNQLVDDTAFESMDKAFNELLKEGHSGMSISITANLIRGLLYNEGNGPMTIEDATVTINNLKTKEQDPEDETLDMYIESCYDSALETYIALMEDNKINKENLDFVIGTFFKLIDHKPLIPLTEETITWVPMSDFGEPNEWQCAEYSSLFKKIDKEGNISYNDVSAFYCKSGDQTFSSGGIYKECFFKHFPITFPYDVNVNESVIYVKDYLLFKTKDTNDFDTTYIEKIVHPVKGEIIINEWYVEDENGNMVLQDEQGVKKIEELIS